MMTTIESKPISHDKNKTKHSDSYKSANKDVDVDMTVRYE